MGDEKRKPTWIMFPYTPTEEELARARELLASEYHPKSGTYKEGTTIGTDPAVIPSSSHVFIDEDWHALDENWHTHPMNELVTAACRVVAQFAVGSFYSDLTLSASTELPHAVLMVESTLTPPAPHVLHACIEITLEHDMTIDEAQLLAKKAVMRFNLDQCRMQRGIEVGGTITFSLDRTIRDAQLAKIINVDDQGKIKVGGKSKVLTYTKIEHGRERG